MASITIEIDQEVYQRLKDRAEPFVDSPNDVLRRMLGLPEARQPQVSSRPRAYISHRRKYLRTLILVELLRRDGDAHAHEVLDSIESIIKPGPYNSGIVAPNIPRWKKDCHFARYELASEGLLRRHAPRGRWILTESGKEIASGAGADKLWREAGKDLFRE